MQWYPRAPTRALRLKGPQQQNRIGSGYQCRSEDTRSREADRSSAIRRELGSDTMGARWAGARGVSQSRGELVRGREAQVELRSSPSRGTEHDVSCELVDSGDPLLRHAAAIVRQRRRTPMGSSVGTSRKYRGRVSLRARVVARSAGERPAFAALPRCRRTDGRWRRPAASYQHTQRR